VNSGGVLLVWPRCLLFHQSRREALRFRDAAVKLDAPQHWRVRLGPVPPPRVELLHPCAGVRVYRVGEAYLKNDAYQKVGVRAPAEPKMLTMGRRLKGLFLEILPPMLLFFIALMLIFNHDNGFYQSVIAEKSRRIERGISFDGIELIAPLGPL
jgi:hypothetical protein